MNPIRNIGSGVTSARIAVVQHLSLEVKHPRLGQTRDIPDRCCFVEDESSAVVGTVSWLFSCLSSICVRILLVVSEPTDSDAFFGLSQPRSEQTSLSNPTSTRCVYNQRSGLVITTQSVFEASLNSLIATWVSRGFSHGSDTYPYVYTHNRQQAGCCSHTPATPSTKP